jgi:N-acyl-D-amino-acid deacylase
MPRRSFLARALLTAALAGSAVGVGGQEAPPAFDVLIRNARVLDGSGNPWFRADIGIKGDRIARVGAIPRTASAAVTIDARDRIVAPGFIDVHSHALDAIGRAELRDARALVAQGVTTIVGNPDGGGPVDLKQQAAALEADGGIGVNAALLIGHAAVRRAVIGGGNRQPTADELQKMRALVRQAAADGAFGLSSGLFYVPGRYAKTDEVIALAAEAGGVYTSHIRDESNYDAGLVASVKEVIAIAEQAHVRGVVTHMKCLGPETWGLSKTIVADIEAARARGVEVYADQYPYEASSTSLAAAVMPGESVDGIREAMAGPESRAKFLAVVKDNIKRRGGPKSIVMASGRGATGLAGQSLEQIGAARGMTPEQAATDVVLAGGASIVSFNMSEDDIDVNIRQTWTMGSSDGTLVLPSTTTQPHPRNNGAMARRLARYVRERHVITLEHAVRTMTSLPARVFGLTDRGEIREGALADLVVFDPARVVDRATYQQPYELADGVDVVLVNGQFARNEGAYTGAKAGRVLKRPQ